MVNPKWSYGLAEAGLTYKSDKRNKRSKFRPISILPHFSKFFEEIMYNRLMDYFLKMNVLSPNLSKATFYIYGTFENLLISSQVPAGNAVQRVLAALHQDLLEHLQPKVRRLPR